MASQLQQIRQGAGRIDSWLAWKASHQRAMRAGRSEALKQPGIGTFRSSPVYHQGQRIDSLLSSSLQLVRVEVQQSQKVSLSLTRRAGFKAVLCAVVAARLNSILCTLREAKRGGAPSRAT